MALSAEVVLHTLAMSQLKDAGPRATAEANLAGWSDPSSGSQLATWLALIATNHPNVAPALVDASRQFDQMQASGRGGYYMGQQQNVDPSDPNHPYAVSMRQLAAILLKRFVKQFWSSDDDGFVGPYECTPEEKSQVRSILLPAVGSDHFGGLLDLQVRVRTAVAMAVASIAQWDLPDEWPELLPTILAALQHSNSLIQQSHGPELRAARTGCMRCLALITEKSMLGDDAVSAMIFLPGLFDQLLFVFQCGAGSEDKQLQQDRAMSVRVMASVVRWLAMVKSTGNSTSTVVKPFFQQVFPSWIPSAAEELQRPYTGDCAVKIALLQLFALIAGDFPREMCANLIHLVASLWTVLSGALPYYQQGVVDSSENLGDIDEEGDTLGIEVQALMALTWVRTMMEHSATRDKLIDLFSSMDPSWITTIADMCIRYMQVTEASIETWEDDPSMYVFDEDDEFGVRASALFILSELIENVSSLPVLASVTASIRSILEKAFELQNLASQSLDSGEGEDRWWKLREAAHYAAGGIARFIIAHEQSSANAAATGYPAEQLAISTEWYIEQVLSTDAQQQIQDGQLLFHVGALLAEPCNAILAGSALRCASKLLPGTAGNQASLGERILHVSASIITAQHDHYSYQAVCLDLGACRCIARLTASCRPESTVEPLVDPGYLAPMMPGVLTGVLSLVQVAQSDVLQLYLETLAEAARVEPAATARFADQILPIISSVWIQNIADRLVADEAFSVLSALSAMPECLGATLSHVTAFCATLLADSHDLAGLTAGAVALCGMLLKAVRERTSAGQQPAFPQELITMVHGVFRVAQRSDDPSIMQEACDTLSQLIQLAGSQLTQFPAFDASGAQSNMLQLCVNIVIKLLHEDLGDTAALEVGPLITALITYAGDVLAGEPLVAILVSVCHRLGYAALPSLKQPLVCVFARLILLQPDECIAILHGNTVKVVTDSKAAYLAQQQRWQETHGHVAPSAPIDVPFEERNALEFMLQTWFDTHEDFSGAYYLKLSALGICKLMDMALGVNDQYADANSRATSQQILSSLSFLGEETDISRSTNTSSTRPHTRSRGAIQMERRRVSLPVRALSVILQEYLRALEQDQDAGEAYDDDEEDTDSGDEGEEDESYEAFMKQLSGGQSFVDPGMLSLALGINITGDDESDDDEAEEEDNLGIKDISLVSHIPQWMQTTMSVLDPSVPGQLYQELTPDNQQTLQSILYPSA